MVFLALLGFAINSHAAAAQKSFASADEAVKTAVAAARSNNDKDLLAIFGTQAKDLLSSGDPVADKERRAKFLAAYDQKNRLVAEGESMILVIGNNDWPFPIPVVKKSEGWVFDTAKGREEVLNRRIGRTSWTLLKSRSPMSTPSASTPGRIATATRLVEYAQKFRSDPGKKNGLYWEAKAGEESSPLGPFAARAVKARVRAKQTRQARALPWLLLSNSYRPGQERAGRRL